MHRRLSWAAVPLLIMFVVALGLWPVLPDPVPIRWAAGHPTRFAGRAVALLAIPMLALGTSLTIGLRARRHENRDLLTSVHGTISVALMIGYLDLVTSFWGYGHHPAAALGIILAGAGFALPFVPPNGLVGIRTPWTMGSRRAWVRTNRLGGGALVGLGVMLALLGAFDVPQATSLALLAVLALSAVLTAYSYWEWRRDPSADRAAG